MIYRGSMRLWRTFGQLGGLKVGRAGLNHYLEVNVFVIVPRNLEPKLQYLNP